MKSSSYDFIVIGTGPGGSMVSKILSENARNRKTASILIIERGGFNKFAVSVKKYGENFSNAKLYKEKYTVKQCGLHSKRVWYLEPNTVGGASIFNGKVAIRGDRLDYVSWPTGWKFYDLKPYFDRVDKIFKIGDSSSNSSTTLTNHDVSVKKAALSLHYHNVCKKDFKNGKLFNNHDKYADSRSSSSGTVGGVGYVNTYTDKKTDTVTNAYTHILRPTLSSNRKNITMMTNLEVIKIIFGIPKKKAFSCKVSSPLSPLSSSSSSSSSSFMNSNENKSKLKIAIGVLVKERYQSNSNETDHVSSNSKQFKIFLNPGGRIFCCAGTINSPVILMNSGIGDSRTLRINGIKPVVVENSNVGLWLHDQPRVNLGWILTTPRKLIPVGGSSSSGSNSCCATIGSSITSVQTFTKTPCDKFRSQGIQTYFSSSENIEKLIPMGFITFPREFALIRRLLRWLLSVLIWISLAKYWLFPYLYFAVVTLGVSKSRGKVHIDGSANPNYLADKSDLDAMVDGVMSVMELTDNATTTSTTTSSTTGDSRSVDKLISHELIPGYSKSSREKISKWVKKSTGSTFHMTSTCRMGDSSKDSVTDSKNGLRVFGTSNLHVIDASSFRNNISTSNTMTIYALAMRAFKDINI